MTKNPYIILLAVYALIAVFLNYFHPLFANSNFFFAITTFLVGSLALYVYTQQKTDEKSNAAISLVTEIRNAENKIDIIIDILNSNTIDDLPSVLPINSWQKYANLFVKDFDSDELQLINSFYSGCEIIEDFVARQNNFFWVTVEERTKTFQRLLAKIHDDFQVDCLEETPTIHPRADAKFTARKDGLNRLYANEIDIYSPKKPIDVLKFQTQKIQKIMSTSSGVKLKKIANL